MKNPRHEIPITESSCQAHAAYGDYYLAQGNLLAASHRYHLAGLHTKAYEVWRLYVVQQKDAGWASYKNL